MCCIFIGLDTIVERFQYRTFRVYICAARIKRIFTVTVCEICFFGIPVIEVGKHRSGAAYIIYVSNVRGLRIEKKINNNTEKITKKYTSIKKYRRRALCLNIIPWSAGKTKVFSRFGVYFFRYL